MSFVITVRYTALHSSLRKDSPPSLSFFSLSLSLSCSLCSVKLEMGYDLTSGHFIVPFKLLSSKIFIFWAQEAKSVTAQRADKKESERKKKDKSMKQK